MFHEALERVQQRWPNIVPANLYIKYYSFARTLRLGAMAEAPNQNIPKEVIKANNWWKAQEAAKGGRAVTGRNMMEHYTEVRAAIVSSLHFRNRCRSFGSYIDGDRKTNNEDDGRRPEGDNLW